MHEEESANTPQTSQHSNLESRKNVRAKRRSRHILVFFISFFASVATLVVAAIAVFFATPWGSHMRILTAETIVSTRHYTWAQYMTTHSEYVKLLKGLDAIQVKPSNTTDIQVKSTSGAASTPTPSTGSPSSSTQTVTSSNVIDNAPVQVIPLDENGYTGNVMLVHNPKLVRLVPAQVHGAMGEYITHMAKRVGAIAGINASGFEDPKGNGWGGIPVGLEYFNGQVIQQSKRDPSWATVGFTKNGVLVMGNESTSELAQMNVRDAMQFHPELVVNGQPTITQGDGGWGLDPRTAIGQAKDGTVIFVTINGRLHGGSIGASMKQVMDIMLRYHAVNACAMDGGSSAVMYDNGNILNSPSTIDPNGERHLPDAWMVFPTEATARAFGN